MIKQKINKKPSILRFEAYKRWVNQGLHTDICAQNGDKQYSVGARSLFYFHTGGKNVTLYGVADALWKPSLINKPTMRVLLAWSSIFLWYSA